MAFETQYGFSTKTKLNALQLELFCYRSHAGMVADGIIDTKWTHHFKQAVNILWGPHNKAKHFQWNPWAEQALEAIHYHPVTGAPYPYTGLSGCGSSGKTTLGALHALVNWMCDPINTLVLVTSTDLAAARKRVWGEITEFWQAAQAAMPGKLVESKGIIVTVKNGQKLPDKSGISLVAGEKRKERDAIGKIIGAKNKRVFMIADELPELTEAILEASLSNLATNPMFQIVAMGNFKSRYDPFGVFVRPKDGYDSITIEDTHWETELGHCVRFDGLKSPNILGGENKWKGIYGSKQLAEHRKSLGENTAGFWRMCRSFEAPLGQDNCIYSESDFASGRAREFPTWRGDYVKVSGLDPSFTNGGDRTVQWFGKLGMDTTGKMVLCLYKKTLLREDVRIKDKTRNFQIAEQFRDNCMAEQVNPRYAGVDATAAGGVFCDIVNELWSREILRVDFSGSPSDLLVSSTSPKTARDSYDRRVTELWYVGLEFMKSGQLKGLTDELGREMKARHYETVKGAEGLKMRVETKLDMKERLGFSPDEADAFFVLLDVCRQRLGFLAGGVATGWVQAEKDWNKEVESANEVYSTVDYSGQEEQYDPYQIAV